LFRSDSSIKYFPSYFVDVSLLERKRNLYICDLVNGKFHTWL